MPEFVWTVVILFSASTGYASSLESKLAEVDRLCADKRLAEAVVVYTAAFKQMAETQTGDTPQGVVFFRLVTVTTARENWRRQGGIACVP